MTAGTKKLFDIAEAFCKKVLCKTSVALVYARPLASGRWSTISHSGSRNLQNDEQHMRADKDALIVRFAMRSLTSFFRTAKIL